MLFDPVGEIVSRNWAAASLSIVGRVSGHGYWQNYQFEGKIRFVKQK